VIRHAFAILTGVGILGCGSIQHSPTTDEIIKKAKLASAVACQVAADEAIDAIADEVLSEAEPTE